jgi:hypothetical protein
MEVEALAKVAFVCQSLFSHLRHGFNDRRQNPPQGVGLENLTVDGLRNSAVCRVLSRANHVKQQHALPVVAKSRVSEKRLHTFQGNTALLCESVLWRCDIYTEHGVTQFEQFL